MSQTAQLNLTAAGLAYETQSRPRNVGIAFLAMCAKFVSHMAERRRVKRAEAALYELSDRTLADIGIDRHSIPYVARHGRDAFLGPR
jgi:uncharacterized protein YjiS (DUF1127 family)